MDMANESTPVRFTKSSTSSGRIRMMFSIYFIFDTGYTPNSPSTVYRIDVHIQQLCESKQCYLHRNDVNHQSLPMKTTFYA